MISDNPSIGDTRVILTTYGATWTLSKDTAADGNFVAFVSFATDLVSGQRAAPYTNVFVYDNRPGSGGVRTSIVWSPPPSAVGRWVESRGSGIWTATGRTKSWRLPGTRWD